jgi:uncharacterized protein
MANFAAILIEMAKLAVQSVKFDRRLPLAQLDYSAGTVIWSGELGSDAMPRVAEQTLSVFVQAQVASSTADLGRRCLTISLNAQVGLTCQRCLQLMQFELVADSEMLVAKTQTEFDDWDDAEHDVLMMDEAVTVQDLIEDEILLGLPSIPRCDNDHSEGRDEHDGRPLQGCAALSLEALLAQPKTLH